MTSKNQGGRPRSGEPPQNTFTAWMDKSQISAADLADKLGIAQSSIYGLRDGRFRPGLDLAVKIHEVTGIPVADWTKAV